MAKKPPETAEYWAGRYLAAGLPFIMLPYGDKSPHKKKFWYMDRPTPEEVAAASPTNLGILMGADAENLIGIDPDWSLMAEALSRHAPPTGLVMGREGKKHPIRYFYRLATPIKSSATLKDPTLPGDKSTVYDVLWTGKQSVVPPSKHPDGGLYFWHKFEAPATIEFADLERVYKWCGAAAMMAAHWPDGGRHDTTLALSGGLLSSEWTLEQAEAFLTEVLTLAGDNEVEDRLRALRDTDTRIGIGGAETVGWQRLGELTDERLVRRIRDLLGITEVRRLQRLATITELRLTDEGNAQRMFARFGDKIRYVPQSRKWFMWDGTRWNSESKWSIITFAVETVRQMHVEAATIDDKARRIQLVEHAIATEDVRRLRAMAELAQAIPELRVMIDEFDSDPWRLNCKNGVLDLRSFQLSPHDPNDLFTRVTGAHYIPDAPAPRWQQFLREIFLDDEEIILYARRVAGLALTGVIRDEVMFLFVGDGANGKSKYLGGLREADGDYAGVASFDTFDADSGRNGVGNDLAALRGRRLVTAIETDQERRLAEAKVKRLTGGDPIICRHLYGEFFEYTPTYKIFLAVNHKPVIRGGDHGIWRRLHVLPFDATFEGEHRDANLEAALAAERDGILAWQVEGLKDYLAIGLAPPEKVLETTAVYKEEMNLLGGFIADVIATDPEDVKRRSRVSNRELYQAYAAWCDDFGERKLSHRMFTIHLRKQGFDTYNQNGARGWVGIKIRPQVFSLSSAASGE